MAEDITELRGIMKAEMYLLKKRHRRKAIRRAQRKTNRK